MLASGPAYAQPASDVERAQTAFKAGRALMADNKLAEACAKFEESQRLDPGGGTILNLGICRKREGRTGEAFKILTQALERARADARSDRIATAEKNLAELAPVLSRLTVELWAGAPLAEVSVELDGERLPADVLGRAQVLDPGPHRLRVSQAGHEPWTGQLTLGPTGDAQNVTIPELPRIVAAPPPALAAAPVGPKMAPAKLPPPVPPASPKRASRALSYALISGGGVALAAGAYFGLRALSLRDRSNEFFDGSYCTRRSCIDDWADAKTSATLSTVTLGVGAVALGVGGYLLLRAEQSASPRPLALFLGAAPGGARASATYRF